MSEQDNGGPAEETQESTEQVAEDSATPENENENSVAGDSESDAEPNPEQIAAGVKRRSILAGVLGAAVGAIPAIIASVFFLDPLIKKWFPKKSTKGGADAGVEKDAEGRILLGVTLDSLPEDGTPQSYTVYDDIVNAWNKFPNQPIGTIWLRRIKDAEPPVLAFSSICPHLGCAVEHRKGEGDFYCPCHTSSFDLDGKKNNEIPPRAMDTLEIKITDGNKLWLEYKEYRGATSEQVEVS
jgi:menaquinol-cytochrome c reductase iron-sulfur subunit